MAFYKRAPSNFPVEIRAGNLDVLSSFSAQSDSFVEASRGDAAKKLLAHQGPTGTAVSFFYLNLRNDQTADGEYFVEPHVARLMNNAKFRKAISLVLDRDLMVDRMGGLRSAHASFTTEAYGKWYHECKGGTKQDVKGARALLREIPEIELKERSGKYTLFSQGKRVKLKLVAHEGLSSHFEALRPDFEALGIQVDFRPTPSFAAHRKNLPWTLSMGGRGGVPLLDDYQNMLLAGGSSRMWDLDSKKPIREWEKAMEKSYRAFLTSTDDAERERLSHETQEILCDELPLIPFLGRVNPVIVSRELCNVQAHPVDGTVVQPELWFYADSNGNCENMQF